MRFSTIRKPLLGIIGLFSQIVLLAKGPELQFLDKRVIDYGNVTAGDPLEIKIRFKNVGDAPLKILEAHKSCTCTEVVFPVEEILPGKESAIMLKVETKGKKGSQSLVVSLDMNTDRGYEILRVDVNYI